MKKTVYFTSSEQTNYGWNQIKIAVDSAVVARDTFFKENINDIGRIDDEDIKIIVTNNGQYISALIKLSYYPK